MNLSKLEFHKRLLAYIIDLVLLYVYLRLSIFLILDGVGLSESTVGFTLIMILLPLLFYTLLTELWMNGQTLGKRVLRIRVVSLDGGEPTLGQYLIRAFARFYEWGAIIFLLFWGNGIGLMALIFGGITCCIIIAVSQKGQRLGDILAGTVVVNTRTKLSVEDTIFMNVATTDYQVTFPNVMRLSDRDINTVKGVLQQAKKSNNYDMCNRVAYKVKDVLKINSDLYPDHFLEKLLEDYNYLATKE